MNTRHKRLLAVALSSVFILTLTTLQGVAGGDISNLFALKKRNISSNNRVCLYGETSDTHPVPPYNNEQVTQAEINAGQFTRNTDNGNPVNFVISKQNSVFDSDGDLLGLNTGGYFYNTTPLNGINKIDYKWKQYDMYIDFGYQPITYTADQVGDETHLPETVIKRVKINGNADNRGAKSNIFDDESFFDGEDFNYIRFQSIDSDGGTNWLKGIDIYYSCQAVTHFKHVDQVNPERGGEGVAEHYVDYEGNYYNLDKEPVSYESLIIKSEPKHFDVATDLTIKLDEPISTNDIIYIDYKFVNGTSESKIAFSLLGNKASGSDWDNFLGYFDVYSDHVVSNNGISFENITDDGYTRIKDDMNEVKIVSGTKPAAINALYVRGGWSNVEGYIEFNSQVADHTKGLELIPEKINGGHGDDGYQAHYECTGCNDYWFDEQGNLCKKEDLIVSELIEYAPPSSGDTLVNFNNIGNITDKIWIDIHFDNPTKHQEVGINFYETDWNNYYGTYWVDCDDKGVYFEGNYAGLELNELEDGWWRVTAYPAALSNYHNDHPEIAQTHSIDHVWLKFPGNTTNRGSGMVEFMSNYDKVVPSTKVYAITGGNSYATDRIFSRGEKIALDIKFKNNSQANIVLMQDWDTVVNFKVKPDGKLVDEANGVQVFKLNNYEEGYPTLGGTWYRVIVDLAWVTPQKGMENYKYINRIGGNRWNEANFDMMINSPYTTDGWYTINGGSTNTQIQFKAPTPIAIRDGNGDLLDKELYLEVKATGSGKVYFSPMDYDWHNCGKYVLTFVDGALTDCVVQGSANKWPTRTDLGNGAYALTIELSKLPGDGLGSANIIGFFNNEDGVLANGVSSFSLNLLSMKVQPIGSHIHTLHTFHAGVDADRENDGIKGYYECTCGKFFDSNLNEVLPSNPGINPSRLYSFSPSNRPTIQIPLDYQVDYGDELILDFKVEPSAKTEIGFTVGDTTSNYFGKFWIESVDRCATRLQRNDYGLTSELLDDGYLRVIIPINKDIISSGRQTNPNSIKKINVLDMWASSGDDGYSTATGTVEVMPSHKGQKITPRGKGLKVNESDSGSFTFAFDHELSNQAIVNLDVYYFSGDDSNLSVNIGDNSNYYGNYKLKKDLASMESFAGITKTVLDDGYIRYTFRISELTKLTGSNPVFKQLFIRGAWSKADCLIDISYIDPLDSPILEDIY